MKTRAKKKPNTNTNVKTQTGGGLKGKGYKIALGIVIALIILVIAAVAGFFVLRAAGKSSLKKNIANAAPVLAADTETGFEEEGVVYHNGQKYRYNEELTTILCIGVDSREDTLKKNETLGNSGQADAIFLLVIDEANQKMSVIAIPRDTMTRIDVYDLSGQYYNTVEAQLALQYAYGDGAMLSCEMMEKAVSNLMYQLPIHACAAINMNAIGVVNDAVGGVTLTALEDLEEDYGSMYKEGETVTLMGDEARLYVQARNENEDYSAVKRLARQKQYLLAFMGQAIQAMKSDITLPLTIYGELSEYMVTDVTAGEITYLATAALNCSFSEDSFYIVAGEQEKGEVYEEYHVDEDALYEMILDIFYIPEED
ncbi:MAG: LCP family protein [Roseburia sp.]|nr:LCP family protein [Roseburia sp.]